MKKLSLYILSLLIFACSSDKEEGIDEFENTAPTLANLTFQVDEHSEAGTSIGTISAIDAEEDALTFTIDNASGLAINEESGEITIGNNLVLDFETNQTLPFTVSVFDGKTTSEKAFQLTINDINEVELLSDEQKEVIAYYQYLTLWQAPTNSPLTNASRWTEPMKLYLDGQITAQFRTNVETVLEEYNEIFENSDFNIALVETYKPNVS